MHDMVDPKIQQLLQRAAFEWVVSDKLHAKNLYDQAKIMDHAALSQEEYYDILSTAVEFPNTYTMDVIALTLCHIYRRGMGMDLDSIRAIAAAMRFKVRVTPINCIMLEPLWPQTHIPQ